MPSLVNNQSYLHLRRQPVRPLLAGFGARVAASGSRPALVRMIAGIPAGNHMPKPPVEVYPLFAIVAVPLSFACWIMYEKLVNDTGVIITTPRWHSGFENGTINDPNAAQRSAPKTK